MKNPLNKNSFTNFKKAVAEFVKLREAEKQARELVKSIVQELDFCTEDAFIKKEFLMAAKALFYCEDTLWGLADLEKEFNEEDIKGLEFMVKTLKLTTSNLKKVATRLKKR